MPNWWKRNAFELTIIGMYVLAGIYGAVIIKTPDSLTANIIAVMVSAVMLTIVVWSIVRILRRG